jgi:hypothetical protein
MSIASKREAVNAAEADVVIKHQALRQHLQGFDAARHSVVTPGRIVVTGLAVGFIAGKAVPAIRQPEAKAGFDRGTDALQRIMRLVQSALPMVMPVWAALNARNNGSDDLAKAEAKADAAAQAAARAEAKADTLH